MNNCTPTFAPPCITTGISLCGIRLRRAGAKWTAAYNSQAWKKNKKAVTKLEGDPYSWYSSQEKQKDFRIWVFTREDPRKPGIIFWRAGPLEYRLAPLGECSRNPSIISAPGGVVKGHVQLQWSLFWRLFQHVCPFHDGWFITAPAHSAECSAVFDQKQHVPRPPFSLFTWSGP